MERRLQLVLAIALWVDASSAALLLKFASVPTIDLEQLGTNRAPRQSTRRLRDLADMVLRDEAVLRYSTELVTERAERAGVWLVIAEELPRRSKRD